MSIRNAVRSGAFLLLMAAVGWFFASQVRAHWAQLASYRLVIHWPWIVAGLLLVLIHYLAATAAWRIAMYGAATRPLSYAECVAFSNISQLTKYVPGKVWSYAIQMHLLASHGVSKTRVLSTNLLMLLSLMASAAVIGCGYLMFTRGLLPSGWSEALFAVVAAAYLCLVFGGTRAINGVVSLADRVLGRNIARIDIPLRKVLHIHALNLGANVVYGVAGYLVAVGVGAHTSAWLVGPVASATLLSDTAGFLAIVAPGGIGVREGVMYAMLKPFMEIQIAFALLVAFRLVTMAGDLLLGATAAGLLYRFTRNAPPSRNRKDHQNA